MEKKNDYLKTFIILTLLFIAIITFGLRLREEYNKEETKNNIMSNTKIIEENEWIPVENVDITEVNEDIIGYLSMPTLKNSYYITMPIKDTTELNILATAIGHFENTPYLEGNICLVAHNSGTNKSGQYVGYFDKIKDLKIGDEIVYHYKSKDYVYNVASNTIISENDLSVLENGNIDKNTLTLITCVKGTKNRIYRYCLVAERQDA